MALCKGCAPLHVRGLVLYSGRIVNSLSHGENSKIDVRSRAARLTIYNGAQPLLALIDVAPKCYRREIGVKRKAVRTW